MTRWMSDIRFAARRLRHSTGFSLAAVLMLALGIGASVAMFSVLKGVVLSGLPYPGGERLVAVATNNPLQNDAFARLTPAEAVHFEGDERAFEAFGYYDWAGMTLLDEDRPREITIGFVSAGFFPALGIAPLHGRTFDASDMVDEQGSVVLSYMEWQRLTGGDPAAIGTFIDTTNEGRFRIIGVMPPEFAFPIAEVGAWRPFLTARLQADQPGYRNARFLDAIGRFPMDVAPATARDRVQQLADQVREGFGMPDAGWRITATPLLEDAVGQAGRTLWASFAVALLVLLVACANVAILIDARQIGRRREQAIALAIGASSGRLYRIMLIELTLLGFAGALVGTLLAGASLEFLVALAEGSLPRADQIHLDRSVLAFAVLIALLTPLLSMATGAFRLRGAPIEAMRGGSNTGTIARRGLRTRSLPVIGVALSTLGLVAAAAMVASLMRIKDVQPGFASENVVALQLFRNGGPGEWVRFAEQLRSRIAAVPGVDTVAVTSAAPLSNIGNLRLEVKVPGRPEPEPMQVSVRRVSAGYLEVLKIPLLAGRYIADSDRASGEKVAVVSRELVRQVFGDRDALGESIALPLGEQGWTSYRIVGISADIRNAGLRADAVPEILVPFEQVPWVGMTFLVAAQAGVSTLPAQLREAMWALDPRQAATREFILQDDLDDELKPARFFARAIGGFSLCALLLAALGVYAVAAQRQQQRRAEFGLKLAIGAPPARLAWQSVLGSLRSAVVGIALGAAGGWSLLRVLESQGIAFGAVSTGWLSAALAVITLAVLIASVPPAVRSARTDPMIALRQD